MRQPAPTILITRPEGQHQYLLASCESLGFNVRHLPCLTISPIDSIGEMQHKTRFADVILFTSRNAVVHAHKQLPLPWLNKAVHAIGSATASSLAELNQAIEFDPEPPFNSESFLQQLSSKPPQKILIVKGAGGRDLIASALKSKGWEVDTVDVYRRSLPVLSAEDISSAFRKPSPQIISITSNETLENLVTLVKDHWKLVRDLPLVVNSQRCQDLANAMGFTQQALVASSAGDIGQIELFQQWLESQKTHD
ncbi:MAG: uroporphyrinogen-III synthase [Granulosicoccus sp.]